MTEARAAGTTATATTLLSRQRAARLAAIVGTALVAAGAALWWQQPLDTAWLLAHNGLRESAGIVTAARAVSRFGMPFELFVLLAYLLLAIRSPALRGSLPVVLVTLLLFGIAGVGGDLLKEVFDRPRPFVTLAGRLVAFSQAATPAFPSGHATKSVALAAPFVLLLARRDRRYLVAGGVLATIAAAVCYSRVVLGAHYVSDVLAGAGLALACLPLAIALARRILRSATPARLAAAARVWAVIILLLALWIAFGS